MASDKTPQDDPESSLGAGHLHSGDGRACPVEVRLNLGNGRQLSLDQPGGSRKQRKVLKLSLIFGFWMLIAAISLGNTVLIRAHSSCQEGGLTAALQQLPTFAAQELPPYLFWALLTLLILWLSRRFSIGRHNWKRRVPLHLGIALLAVLAVCVFKNVSHNYLLHTDALLRPNADWHLTFDFILLGLYGSFLFDFFIYSAILAAGFALNYYRTSKEQQTQAARLEAQAAQLQMQLAQAQYQALRMQIHPHFLFNTLNTISALVERDPDATRRTVARMSDLLRRALESTDEQEVLLADELKFAESYLAIEQIRFQDRLEVRIRVDADVRGALVPNLLLQPLVENAVHHGITRSVLKGLIEVRGERRGPMLFLSVRDNGPGMGGDGAPGHLREGIGLSNTRARLKQLYGDACSLTLRNDEKGGFIVEVMLPYRTAGQPHVDLRQQIADTA